MAKASLISPEQYPSAVAQASRDTPLAAAQVAAVYEAYESLKARADGPALLDFDDLLLHTAAAIEDDTGVAEEFRDRYRCFVVDEYQDVTPLQQRVLSAWLGDRDDLTVVGDANQTIYSFTGASPRYLLDFPRRFPEATVIRLERDYRSTPQVVSLANRVIAAARGRMAGSRLHLTGSATRTSPVVSRTSRRGRRGGCGGGLDRETHRVRHTARRDRGAVPDQRAVRGLRGGVDRGRHPLPGPRRRRVLQPPGDQAGAAGLQRAADRGADGELPSWCAVYWNRWD
ncbi:uvrD/REP helicase N-terminal domain protein [Mycobacterium xenopi 3993]|nr:uvrD/REP helicase N-terminal domain protein [Mycobacterium xenopi 3993]